MTHKQGVQVPMKLKGLLNVPVDMIIETKLQIYFYTELLHARLRWHFLSIKLDGFGYVVWLRLLLKQIAMLLLA